MPAEYAAKPVVEVNEDSDLHLSSAMAQLPKPRARFVVDVQGEKVVLSPERSDAEPFWKTATREERVGAFRRWVATHRDGPNLPDEALRRENIYD